MKKKIYFFLGTTAELIKVAPVMRELDKRGIEFKIIASGQSPLNIGELRSLIGKHSIDYALKLKPFTSPKNIYLRFLTWIIKSFGNYLIYFRNEFKGESRKNAIFIIHGDTVSSLFGAVIAKICRVRLVHIESGLRSFNFLGPFPEELSRFIISWLADVHFCPNSWAIKNLKRHHGVKINTFYNTIGENLQIKFERANRFPVGVSKKKFFVLVMHRQEHLLLRKNTTKKILSEVVKHASNDLNCIFVMHRLTKDFLEKESLFNGLKKNKNIILLPRTPYFTFINLLKKAEFVVTDGGSNQEELYFLGKPCLIIRSETERIEGLGENALLSNNELKLIRSFIENYKLYKRKRVRMRKKPSKIVVDYLLR